jgi:hypothetical protein
MTRPWKSTLRETKGGGARRFFRPVGASWFPAGDPRLTPWAAFFCRVAAATEHFVGLEACPVCNGLCGKDGNRVGIDGIENKKEQQENSVQF